MFSIFYKSKYSIFKEFQKYQKLDYLKSRYNNNLYIIKDYYSKSERYIRRPNLLISLLETIAFDPYMRNEDLLKELDLLNFQSEHIANDFGITTSIKENSDPKYNTIIDNVKEYFLLVKSDIYSVSNLSYIDIEPIKCIYSNNECLFLTHPKEFTNTIENLDIYIYTIDISKLALQYWLWCKDMLELKYDIDPARFLYTVVFVNIIESISEQQLLSRYISTKENYSIREYKDDNPFSLPIIEKYINKLIEYELHILDKTCNESYSDILNYINLINHTGIDVSFIPDIIYTGKNSWLILLSKLDIIIFLLKYYRSKKEKDYENQIKIYMKNAMQNRYLTLRNKETQYLLGIKIDELMNLIKE